MAPRLSGKNCKFFKSLLSLNSQKRLGYKENNTKYRSLTWKPRSHVRILIYRTWPIEVNPWSSCEFRWNVSLIRMRIFLRVWIWLGHVPYGRKILASQSPIGYSLCISVENAHPVPMWLGDIRVVSIVLHCTPGWLKIQNPTYKKKSWVSHTNKNIK